MIILLCVSILIIFAFLIKKRVKYTVLERIRKTIKKHENQDNMERLISKGYYVHTVNGQFSPTEKGKEHMKRKAMRLHD